MATLLWHHPSPRDLASEASSVRATFSSWDSCMSQAYCKWPVIAAIILGSLIALSIIWCCARCLCCGAECCCGCLSCFNRCCPSPRGGRGKNTEGYQPPSGAPYSQGPPMYYGAGGAGGYAPAQTATFAASSKGGNRYNEDALPAMPSWNAAQSRRVEDEDDETDDMEMEKLEQQQQSLLYRQQAQQQNQASSRYYNSPQPQQHTGDLGDAHASPYYDHYSQRQQQTVSPTSTTAPSSMYSSMYPPTYHTGGPLYEAPNANAYPASLAPSYHTTMPSQQSGGYGVPRRPVADSWRNV